MVTAHITITVETNDDLSPLLSLADGLDKLAGALRDPNGGRLHELSDTIQIGLTEVNYDPRLSAPVRRA